MQFIEFPVSSTNIFPLANSHAGGQIMSEFNLRSRETVATDPSIEYNVGPSYAHSMKDFELQTQAGGADISGTAIQISAGRAIVNGHYVELLTPISIDIATVNYKAGLEGSPLLKGDLAVGLVMMYSNYTTLASSALTENEDGYYDGVRVVIVPEDSVKRPIDVPEASQMNEVNMHLLLGTFSFYSGAISNVKQNADKVRIFDASRIGDLNQSMSDIYVTKTDLDPHHFYVFADKRNSEDDPELDTWCQAEESLMKWDTNPRWTTDEPTDYVAHFEYDPIYKRTNLVLPHKQIDGAKNQHGQDIYMATKRYPIPNASFSLGSGGVVTPDYTQRVLHIEEMTNNFYRLPNGKMRKYLDKIESLDDLPPIPVADGSIQSLDISSVVNNVISVITEVIVTLDDNTTTNPNTITNQLRSIRTDIDEIASIIGASGIDNANSAISELNSVKNALMSIQNALSGDTGVLHYLDLATSDLRQSMYSQAATDIERATAGATFADNGLTPINTTSLNSILHDLDSAVNSLTAQKNALHTLPDGDGDIHDRITAVIGTSKSVPNSIRYCMGRLESVISTMNSLEETIVAYVDAEVERRVDEQSVLTSTVWSPGDYVVVASDQTQQQSEDGMYPSTMYVVNYGRIRAIGLVGQTEITIYVNDTKASEKYDLFMHKVPYSLAGGVELSRIAASSNPPTMADQLNFKYDQYYGAVHKDYFIATWVEPVYGDGSDTDTKVADKYINFFYTPIETDIQLTYITPPLMITGGMKLATDTSIGGFFNMTDSDSLLGNGYVVLDSEGHLRVADYNYLALGIEAQQLGQDMTDIGSGMDLQAIQDHLDQYVNDRICYPNATQIETSAKVPKDPHVIEITLNLPSTTEASELVIRNIGSRSGSSLYVHIQGSATSATTITFENCDKLRIDDTISGSPNIILDNVNLYYNANVLDRAYSISDLTLWYERDKSWDSQGSYWYPNPSSPNLQVDGMTVTLLGNIEETINYDPWSLQNPNDNHYSYALRGLTFASDGSIIGLSMLVADSSSANIELGRSVFRSNFSVPQTPGLAYPPTKMTHRLKVTGSFISSYWSYTESKFVIKETEFSALSQQYISDSQTELGSIAFVTDAYLVSHITGAADESNIDCWDLGQAHIFFGGAIE